MQTKIYIDCPWAIDPSKWFSPFVPPDLGVELVDSLSASDYHVVLNESWIPDIEPDLHYEMEPGPIRQTWASHDYPKDYSIARWRMPWMWQHLCLSYPELMELRGASERIDKVVAISSNKDFMVGHRRRLDIQKRLGKSLIDIYGQDPVPGNYCGGLQLKQVAAAYRYQLAVENTLDEPNYVTEKLVDSLLMRCLTFYMGNNAGDFIDPDAFVRLDPEMSDDDVAELVGSHIRDNAWEKRRALIESEARRVLAEESLFPKMVEHLGL